MTERRSPSVPAPPEAPDYRMPRALGDEGDAPRLDGAPRTAAHAGPVPYGPSRLGQRLAHPPQVRPVDLEDPLPPVPETFGDAPMAPRRLLRLMAGTTIAALAIGGYFGNADSFDDLIPPPGLQAPVAADGPAWIVALNESGSFWLDLRADGTVTLPTTTPGLVTLALTGGDGDAAVQWALTEGTSDLDVLRASAVQGLRGRDIRLVRAVRIVLSPDAAPLTCTIRVDGRVVVSRDVNPGGQCSLDVHRPGDGP